MGSHCSFEHLKHKLWPIEGAGSRIANLTPDQKKSGIDPIYLAVDNVPHIVGKLLTRATTLLQTALRSEVCSQSYGAPESRESRERKAIWMWAPWRGAEYTIRGEGGGFPQVLAVVSLVCPCCPWLILAPKVLQLFTNHFVWVVCRPM
jgi:hypothetical protein